MQTFRKKILRQDQSPHPVVLAIREVCTQIDRVQDRFGQETDPDLIEGCIYELESLRSQYRYLLKSAKRQGITCREQSHLWHE